MKGMLKGERKYANVSAMREAQPLAATTPRAEVSA